MNINKTCYVYRFIDINGKCIYVGETNNMSRRMKEHITLKSGKFTKKSINQVQKIEYFKVKNKVEARQFEIYYINKYKPYLNKADKFNNVRISEDDSYERNWKTYQVFRNGIETSPRVHRMALMMVYVAFICIIVMSLSTYF